MWLKVFFLYISTLRIAGNRSHLNPATHTVSAGIGVSSVALKEKAV